jgi:23S rRNA (adenine2030-N6)-methyltransferase
MLSYRHAFHAGNFADVLKHVILIQLLEYFGKKESPFCCIDTHAGAGDYALDSHYALKNSEFTNGIGLLWQRNDLPDAVAPYVQLMKQANSNGSLSHYLGSPRIIQQLLRAKDRLFLYELHSTEVALLSTAMGRDKRVKVFHADGLKNVLGLLPPQERRGLILIDPSYELKTDYIDIPKALCAMYKRFATGTYALWYPVIDRRRNQALERAIQTSGIKNVQLFELGIAADSHAYGMTASGLIIINPPWTLMQQMQTVLPWLVEVLGSYHGKGTSFYRIQTLVEE